MSENKICDIQCSISPFFNYAYFKGGVRLLQRLYVQNLTAEDINGAKLTISSDAGFIIPYIKTLNILPYESTVEADVSDLSYNPDILVSAEETFSANINIRVEEGGKILSQADLKVNILPYGTYCGISNSPELFSSYVRPSQEISKLLKAAGEILKGWKLPKDIYGYEGNDKNSVRLAAAAVYRAIQMTGTSKSADMPDFENPVNINGAAEIFSLRQANRLEIAALYLSCIEAAGLNGVLAAGKTGCLCGVWLTDNCFLDSFSDDITELKKRSAEDINDIAVIDIDFLFAGGNQNFTGAERAGAKRLESPADFIGMVDIKRCRIASFKPLPQRSRTAEGYEVIPEEYLRLDDMPKEHKRNIKALKIKPRLSKDKQWERRLLDLSLKNSLLNFLPRSSVLHIMSVSAEKTASALISGGEYTLMEMPSETFIKITENNSFNSSPSLRPLSELLALEFKNGRIRAFSDIKGLNGSLSYLYRKERTMAEETGASTLFAACGFLKWQYTGGGEEFKYAPLILVPVALIKKTGGKGFSIKAREEGFQFNTTLLEFLKQEFGIDMRGLDDIKEDGDILSALAAVKKQILGIKGWEVIEDVYLASLSFSRFVMWNDIRAHIDLFKKNRLISSLIDNRLDPALGSGRETDTQEPDDIKVKPLLLPLNSDYSQFKAAALSDKGVSFVLHGPPGTGKSQTIANIIANAIGNGKRVLFVAEKMAALSVVKKRLDGAGLGDFCLELHSGKTVKTDVAEKLIGTLALKGRAESDFEQKGESLNELKETLYKPVCALHKVRRLGISVYEGILKLEENMSAPDIMDIESPFFDSLTPENLKVYENLLSELITVCRECGQVYRSPFEDCAVETFEEGLPQKVSTAVKVLLEEARHLKAYANLAFESLGNRVRVLSRNKLSMLGELCGMLVSKDNPYLKIFNSPSDMDPVEVLGNFTSVYRAFEGQEEEYNKVFKQKIELTADPSVLRAEFELFGENYSKSRPLKTLARKIARAAKDKPKPEDYAGLIPLVIGYFEIKFKMAEAGDSLSELLAGGKNEKVNYNEVADLIFRLNKLYGTVQSVFVQYDHVSFNKTLKNLFAEYPSEILKSYINAFKDFERAEKNFFDILKITKDYSAADEDYPDYLSFKGTALLENIDLLPGWCRYNSLCRKFREAGLSFAIAPLKEGKISPETVLSAFNKKVYQNFVEREVSEDETLSRFSASIIEEKVEKFKILCGEYEKASRREIYRRLTERLPDLSTEGNLSVELMQLQRAYKSNMRGISLRNLFAQVKNLFAIVSPCLLMSPVTVARYLEADTDMFDLVVFDEASQMPTAEAVGAVARGKASIIVGDPKQLPPTSFFSADYTDEENLQNEDLESILEDCLALGLPERYLIWHYRSKHESLIAFSNALYYGNRLCTFPSPDALQSKVSLKYVENGVYDRGNTKQNIAEADCLVAEIIKRLKADGVKSPSIGVVTFSVAQQELIENKLSEALIRSRLESAAYDREEPVFVKNLENVQGDERDLILFSICYGPDKSGRLSLNFGPVNQANGWRRLNVAASRAREEMIVYSSMTSAMIDLSKNNSKGVAGVKAFLEFAANGKSMLAVQSSYVESREDGIGKYIAADLINSGLDCRYNLGVSGFKIDAAVVDPRDKKKFILAVICDSKPAYESRSIKDTAVMQVQTLKRLNWNVYRIWTLNYFNNPKREIKKIKNLVEKLCGGKNDGANTLNKFARRYEEASVKSETVLSYFILDKANEEGIKDKMTAIAETEQPISKEYLIKKCLLSYGIMRTGSNINARMEEILQLTRLKHEELNGVSYYRTDDSVLKCEWFRVEEGGKHRRAPQDISPYEYAAAAKGILFDRISLFLPDLVKEVAEAMGMGRVTAEADRCIRYAVDYGAAKNMFTKSVGDMVTL